MNFDIQGTKKYGLQLKKPPAAFAPDEEETMSQQIARQAQMNRAKAYAEAAKVLISDPRAYTYDARRIEKPKEDERSARYHEQVKAKIEQRKREQSLVKERTERKKLEGAEDEERFITPSYLKLLEEQKLLELELDAEDKEKETKTARDTGSFYSHLFKNRAMGHDDHEPKKKPKIQEEEMPEPSKEPKAQVSPEAEPAIVDTVQDVIVLKPASPVLSKEDKLAEARARYLQRKAQG